MLAASYLKLLDVAGSRRETIPTDAPNSTPVVGVSTQARSSKEAVAGHPLAVLKFAIRFPGYVPSYLHSYTDSGEWRVLSVDRAKQFANPQMAESVARMLNAEVVRILVRGDKVSIGTVRR